jgi:nicotinamide-nucleotide amidase
MRIEIICTGDEVLTGKITNTNFSYMAQKLQDVGLSVHWGTTVGDDRDSLLAAFQLAATRADAVIVNGGLGPTVDDLSQEVAAQAAGVELVLHEEWLARMESFFSRRMRSMPPNNVKQAMLPATAEMIDNPIGTACGFALDIGRARFFFTPGVPRELHRMLEQQVIPRILARTGAPASIHLKRFHSYGLGESHVDQLLTGVEALDPDGAVKLGFRAHYPQLETKLTVRGKDMDDVRRKLAPVTEEVRRRLGNFIFAEDDQTLEGITLSALTERQATLTAVETFTAGQIAARIAHLPGAEKVFRHGTVARHLDHLFGVSIPLELDQETTEAVANAAREQTGATHALAVLIELDDGADRIDLGGTIWIGIATANRIEVRRSRILGGREWVRLGAVELALDCLRRFLQGLPVVERIDFEKA